jgi:hypothetical protein
LAQRVRWGIVITFCQLPSSINFNISIYFLQTTGSIGTLDQGEVYNIMCQIKFVSELRQVCGPSWYTVDSRYLEFDGTMEKIRVNRSSTQEELWKYRKCSLFNDERETTRAKFWRAKTSFSCLETILNLFDVFVAVFFLLNSLILVEWLITARYLFFGVYDYVYLLCCIDSIKCRRKLFSTENNANSEK